MWVASAAGGKEIVELDAGGNVLIRNSVTGALERQVRGPVSPDSAWLNRQYMAAADPEAKYAAVIVPNMTVDVVNIGTGAITRVPGGSAPGVAYDGEQLLIQRSSGTFEVRSADGRQLIRSFAGDPNASAGPAVNGAGLAVEVNSNGTAFVFDIASGQEIGSITLPAAGYGSTSVAFTPDGKNLVSATEGVGGSADTSHIGHVTEWSFSPRLWSAVACASAGHTLTSAEWQQYVGADGPGMPSKLAC